MDHIQNKSTGHGCETIFEDAQEKESLSDKKKDGEKIYYNVCADRWEKDENYREQMILNAHTKAELQSWDTQMRKGLTVQNITNHVSCVNRYICEGANSSKLKDKLFQQRNTMSVSWP